MPSPSLTGRCLCGAVTYRADAEPLFTALCHCLNCQRQTGNPFSMICGVPAESLEVSGPLAVFHDVGDSGGAVDRHFCPTCGSPIYTAVAASPALAFLKAGTLEDWRSRPPTMELYRSRAADWSPRLECILVSYPGAPT